MPTRSWTQEGRDALVVAAVGGLLFGATSQRGWSWQDSGLYQLRVQAPLLDGEAGLATAHPLHVLLGHLLTWTPLPFPWSLALLSAAAAAVTLGLLSFLLADLTRDRGVALGLPAVLATTHAFWWLATVAEVYTLSACLLAVELLALTRLLQAPSARWLLLLGLANGAHLAVHDLALLGLPVHAVVVAQALRGGRLAPRDLAGAAAAWCLGAAPLLLLVVRALAEGMPPLDVLVSLLAGDRYLDDVLASPAAQGWGRVRLGLVALSFCGVLLPLALWGLRPAWRAGAIGRAVLALLGIHAAFALRYPVPDQFTFLLPTLLLLAVVAGWGTADLRARGRERLALAAIVLGIAAGPVVDLAAPAVVQATGVGLRPRELPYRDEVAYWARPWKHDEDSADRFVKEAFAEVPEGGMIVACSTARWPLLAAQPHLDDRGVPVVHVRELAADPALWREEAWGVCAWPTAPGPGAGWRLEDGPGVLRRLVR